MSQRKTVLVGALAAGFCGSICPLSYAQAQDTEDPLEVLAKTLVQRLIAKDRTRVTLLDFTDIQGRPNVLGRYLAERLDVQLANMDGITVVDRRNIARIMEEHKLTEEGLIDPANARKLGQFAGVEAILIGSLVIAEDQVELLTKAVSTETSEILSAGRTRLPLTEDFRQWLGQGVALGSRPSGIAGGSPGASSTEGDAIAVREMGPITVVLQNVAEQWLQTDRGALPAIRCMFDLENRYLQRSVAIAANQRAVSPAPESLDRPVQQLRIAGYRGGLFDSNRMPWTLSEAQGISAVVCYEYEYERFGLRRDPTVRQSNPAAIVDYIRSARRYDGKRFRESDHGARFWSGSFGSIPPGEKAKMIVEFLPFDVQPLRRNELSSWTWPDHFRLDMELVLGTHTEGEDPTKARDLMLQNLTIDRVALADKPAAPAP